MVISIKKLLLFLCLFFLFNTLEIDSNSYKSIIFDRDDLYEEGNYTIFFHNISSYELKEILNILNIEVLSYIIDGNKYYYKDIDELNSLYIIDKELDEQLYFKQYGIYIDGINVICTNNELLKLENLIKIY